MSGPVVGPLVVPVAGPVAGSVVSAPNLAGIELMRRGDRAGEERCVLVHGFGLRDAPWPDGVALVRQIHSDIVVDAGAEDADPEVIRKNEPICEGDALITDRPESLIGIKTADCVPILLADPATGAVGAVHAGWRGTAQHIVAGTVREMSARWGVRPENLRAAIGPAIGVCCYQVGVEVARRFGIECSGSVHLDLAKINHQQLVQMGVSNVWVSGECTFCSPLRFYSFRREREQAGRMLSYIGWQKHDGRAF